MIKFLIFGRIGAVSLALTALIMVQPMTFIPLALAQPQFPPLDQPQFPPQSGQIPHSSPPNTRLANLADMWWQWAYNLDTSIVGNPFGDNSLSCTLGQQQGNLLFLTGTAGIFTLGGVQQGETDFTRACTIDPGTRLLIPLLNTECSPIEFGLNGPCGNTPEELRASANQLINPIIVTSLTLVIDGVQVPLDQLYQNKVESANNNGFSLTIAPNNPFGLNEATMVQPPVPLPATVTSVAAGYYILLNPLQPGEHTIEFGGIATFPDGSTFRTGVTYLLSVVPSA
jgi:hypothetical protein